MKILKILLILWLIIIAIVWLTMMKLNQPDLSNPENSKKIAINIPYWTPIWKVWDLLVEKWIINTKIFFFLYIKVNKLEWKIQAWDYILNTPIWIKNLVSQLQNSKQEEIRLIIPEWFTIDDIDNLLTNKLLINEWEFIQCSIECTFPEYNFFYDWNLEWYLFPDTYFVPIDSFSSESFIKRMLSNFQRKVLTGEFQNEYKKQWKQLQQIVTMASIVEREERKRKNMPTIAWILWKRLAEWIPLWADATTRYYKKLKTWSLFTEDFQEDNSYNTRRNRWLPKTAISNPWLDAINATLYPKTTKYYFYLHDNKGVVYYSETNDEHNFKKFKYLKNN